MPARARWRGDLEAESRMVAEQQSYLTVSEVAVLLRLKERRVYALARAGTLPARRMTGRLLFDRAEIELWLAARAPLPTAPQAPAVLVGSHDPLLDWALRESTSGIASFCDGSLDGLKRLGQGEAIAAGLHLAEPDGGGWNRAYVERQLASLPVVLLEWAWRERGLIVPAGNPLRISGIEHLDGRRLVPRQPQSGSQRLLESLLQRPGGTSVPVARNEADAALAVADGKADAAFGLLCMARQFRLDFVPILRERFDLVVTRRAYFEPPFQRLVAFCRSAACGHKAQELGGYDLSGQLQVHFNAA